MKKITLAGIVLIVIVLSPLSESRAGGYDPSIYFGISWKSPFYDEVWVPGRWERRPNDWVWFEGYWGKKPEPRAIWVPGHWEKRPEPKAYWPVKKWGKTTQYWRKPRSGYSRW